MYAIIKAAPSKTSTKQTTIELGRFLTHRQADKAIADMYLAGRFDNYVERLEAAPVWIEYAPDVVGASSVEIGRFRTARDGRSFIQVGRICIWGRKGESEASLRARKDEQIERAA